MNRPCTGPSLRNMATAGMVIPLAEVKRFVRECLVKVGTSPEHASDMADLLAEADYRGHFSHGLNRLENYLTDLEAQSCDPLAEPTLLQETVSTAWVDGNNALGPVVGNFCMKLAITKARETGIGWVVTKGSTHFGITGYYTLQAIKEGMLGMAFTNASPIMTPTRAKNVALGTNPMSVAAPGVDGDSYVLDMATTAVAFGKVEIQRRKGDPIPEGWAMDSEGVITTDAEVAFKAGKLMPLGGAEQNSGYKGYGLGMMVEVFCGILSGSNFGPNIRKWTNPEEGPPNLGQCFVAIDPNCFAPGFSDRMSELLNHVRGMEPLDPSMPVLAPGDPERHHMKKVDEEGGLRYLPNQMESSSEVAKRLGVTPLRLCQCKK